MLKINPHESFSYMYMQTAYLNISQKILFTLDLAVQNKLCFFYQPPGTAKSLLAKAVAVEAIHCLNISKPVYLDNYSTGFK